MTGCLSLMTARNMEYTMQSESAETHRGECSQCGSSDGNVHYSDGHAYCFVCSSYTPPNRRDNVVTPIPTAQSKTMTTLSKGQFSPISDRGISMEAARAYGITVTDGKHIYPYYDSDGNHIANKLQTCLLYTSPSPRDGLLSRMPSSA